jgi:hypothetical protein
MSHAVFDGASKLNSQFPFKISPACTDSIPGIPKLQFVSDLGVQVAAGMIVFEIMYIIRKVV